MQRQRPRFGRFFSSWCNVNHWNWKVSGLILRQDGLFELWAADSRAVGITAPTITAKVLLSEVLNVQTAAWSTDSAVWPLTRLHLWVDIVLQVTGAGTGSTSLSGANMIQSSVSIKSAPYPSNHRPQQLSHPSHGFIISLSDSSVNQIFLLCMWFRLTPVILLLGDYVCKQAFSCFLFSPFPFLFSSKATATSYMCTYVYVRPPHQVFSVAGGLE